MPTVPSSASLAGRSAISGGVVACAAAAGEVGAWEGVEVLASLAKERGSVAPGALVRARCDWLRQVAQRFPAIELACVNFNQEGRTSANTWALLRQTGFCVVATTQNGGAGGGAGGGSCSLLAPVETTQPDLIAPLKVEKSRCHRAASSQAGKHSELRASSFSAAVCCRRSRKGLTGRFANEHSLAEAVQAD